MRKKKSAEVRVIHAEQVSLYNFIILRKRQWTQVKIKQLKQDTLNQWEFIGFPIYVANKFLRSSKNKKYHYIKLNMFNFTVIIMVRVFR